MNTQITKHYLDVEDKVFLNVPLKKKSTKTLIQQCKLKEIKQTLSVKSVTVVNNKLVVRVPPPPDLATALPPNIKP